MPIEIRELSIKTEIATDAVNPSVLTRLKRQLMAQCLRMFATGQKQRDRR